MTTWKYLTNRSSKSGSMKLCAQGSTKWLKFKYNNHNKECSIKPCDIKLICKVKLTRKG